jgi:hypothetical protein
MSDPLSRSPHVDGHLRVGKLTHHPVKAPPCVGSDRHKIVIPTGPFVTRT